MSSRRQFICSGASGIALASLPVSLFATVNKNNDTWKAAFLAAKHDKPWLSAYQSITDETRSGTAECFGQWPEDLRGCLYRNGPARHEIGDFRYHHWFDGDGMVQAYHIKERGIYHRARMIATDKYVAEIAAGRALLPGFSSIPPDSLPITSLDSVNPANISLLQHHGKLLALWEAGSPWELDADNLETKGRYTFSPETRGVPFSAHPRVEPDGTLWNFGYFSMGEMLVLWHIDQQGRLVKTGRITSSPMTMPHDFVVTSKHIVILMPPLNFMREKWLEGCSFLDAHQWQPELPARVLVIEKNDFTQYRWLELPSQWVYHFGNGWEDSNGVIYFDGARSESPVSMTHVFRDIMRGDVTAGVPSRHYHYQIDTKRWILHETPIFEPHLNTEFPMVDPRISCSQNRRLLMLASDTENPPVHNHLNEVLTFDRETGRQMRYRYPDCQIPEEHLFVGKPGSAPETEGWVIGSAHDWENRSTRLNVFDVNAVDAGPLASAVLPYTMPLGLHGKFISA